MNDRIDQLTVMINDLQQSLEFTGKWFKRKNHRRGAKVFIKTKTNGRETEIYTRKLCAEENT